ncbi:protein of unknown function DUF1400 [Gloeothece citriformis PCC 7424]|uniref:DUF1400 domain-containing protein n=1 Tax=Gloeothece citriformis (strain PCC 7424) TaxID=65393 RepID=B7K8X9_GLOC7|nr:alpha/beta hydrolase [Gloeothece citriformis]ACK72748.1 protein of unknown function DUF1400 [Gloeothece citriformis PCC 7424]
MTVFWKTLTSPSTLLGSVCTLLFTFGGLGAPPAEAAERLILQIGPLQEEIKIEDLEQFAYTGEISPQLKPYQFLLTPGVQDLLLRRMHVDPVLAEQFFNQLLVSEDGEKLLEQIQTAIPETTVNQLQTSLKEAIKQPDDLNILSFLRVYPSKTLKINLNAGASIATQLGAANLQSKILTPVLAKELNVPPDAGSFSPVDPKSPGPETVYKETFILRDKSRKRTIPADIYYSFNTKGPLVVMSHGFAADRRFLKYLAYHLASYGLTVVSVEHPGSNIHSLVKFPQGMKLNEILPASEFIERPKDISFVLDELEKINQENSYFHDKFNTRQVSLIGHSFGGYTVLALAGGKLNPKQLRSFCQSLTPLGRSPADWLQCSGAQLPYSEVNFRDSRVVGAIALNPIAGHLFGDSLSEIKIPTLILASSEDGITPNLAHQLQPFQQLQGEKYLMVAVGGTHMSVTDISYLSGSMGQSTLVREVMDEEANPLREATQGVSLAFIKQLTPQGKDYQPFLTPAYVQSFKNEQMSLRLATQLPMTLDVTLNVLSLSHEKITLRQPPLKLDLLATIRACFAHLSTPFSPPQYQTGQLEEIFDGLLRTYNRHSGRLS